MEYSTNNKDTIILRIYEMFKGYLIRIPFQTFTLIVLIPYFNENKAGKEIFWVTWMAESFFTKSMDDLVYVSNPFSQLFPQQLYCPIF